VCPDACTGGCDGPVCTIACTGRTCSDGAITCPADYDCLVACDGPDACDTATITCPDDYACTVTCSGGVDACGDLGLECGGGACAIECGENTCVGAAVHCGIGPCTASCAGDPDPVVACPDAGAGACACTVCP
jgi:hypothetical protein